MDQERLVVVYLDSSASVSWTIDQDDGVHGPLFPR